MVADADPLVGSSVASLAAGCGLAAVASLVWTWVGSRQTAAAVPRASVGRWAFAGAMLLGGPTLSLLAPAEAVSGSSFLIAMALTPVVAGVALSALGGGMEDVAGRMWPGLAAIGGMLLILPQPWLGDPVSDAVLVLAPLLTGVGAALFGTAACENRKARGTWALSGGALLFGATLLIQAVRGHGIPQFSPFAAVLDGVLLLLAVLALSRLGTMRWTAQFALVPLAVMLFAFVAMRPTLDWHPLTGFALLLLAGVFLLLPPEEPEEAATSLNLG